MKKLKVLFSDISLVSRRNYIVIVIFILCASISTACVLTFMSKFKDELTYLEEVEKNKRKYNIAFLKDDVGENEFNIEYVNKLFEGFPKVINMQLIEEERYAYYAQCEFERELEHEEIKKINSIVKYEIYALYSLDDASNSVEHRFIITIILLVFLLVAFNTLNLNRYLIQKNKYRFKIYKLCGAGKLFTLSIMYTIPIVITAISFGLGTLIYKLFLFGFFKKFDTTLLMLSPDLVYITFFANIVFCFILLLPTALSVMKREVL